jgi:hypothetical protein
MKAKKKNVTRKTVYEGADVFDARQALSNGQERPIGWYLQDAAEGLTRISDLLDPPDGNEGSECLQFAGTGNTRELMDDETGPRDDLGEWVGSPAQIEAAIAARAVKPLGWSLRELGDFLIHLAGAFDAPERSRDWQLQFVRKGRGRRPNPEQMLADSAFALEQRMATRVAGKQEAVIKDLEKNKGISRATFFRRKSRTRKAT